MKQPSMLDKTNPDDCVRILPIKWQKPYQQRVMKNAAIIYLRLWKIVTAAKKARCPLTIVGKKENLPLTLWSSLENSNPKPETP